MVRHKRAAAAAGDEARDEKKPRFEEQLSQLDSAGGLSVAPLVRQALRSKDRSAMEKVHDY